ncbi:SpoIIE family protein phosphatase [Streptomyces sp. V2I9]|uniref:SpoIIE family protein phosphatase n=1 Tax=Streptomyces sp. V2I9 TaxID=3042304 RepID=UPI0027898BFA|nr:SpoIIE family protein phosphatase [Streptomyces sp. V2I9]MDQ0982950.1 PAS domain S-box-containing protein [Streptomyces sp. V2I9]
MGGKDEVPVDGLFAADPEIGRDLARVDWAATPLGDPASWPQSLRTTVDILLSSRFSMWMAWGPELTFFCNSSYRRDTLGQKYPWALGRPIREVWPEIWDDISPRVDSVLAHGESTWDEALLLLLQRSGFREESYHTFSYSPLRDDAGRLVGVLCVVIEETQRIIGEHRMAALRDLGSDPAAVRTEEEFLEFSARQLDRHPYVLPFTLTYLFQDDGRARLAATSGIRPSHPAAPVELADNATAPWPAGAALLGETEAVDLSGAPFGGLPHGPWDEPPAQALVVPLVQPGAPPTGFLVAGLNRFRVLDDAYRGFVDLVAGHIAAGLASARAHEAQQRRAEELAELDRTKTAFFSNISHEFRTPLTLITGPVETLRQQLADDPVFREDLDVIHRSGLRLGKLVTALLDFSRIEAGRMQAGFEPVDLTAVTAELAGVFRSAVERASLRYEFVPATLGRPVLIDRGLWEKVVFNLLSNALKFTFEGVIRVSVGEYAHGAEVTVEDTGTGIPAREMPRLFERFHRVEHVRARSHEGSGIGLALVKELVELHGGTVSVSSVEGRGTRFTVRLPFGSAHLPADAVREPGPDHAAPAAGVTAEPFLAEALRWLPDPPDGDLTEIGEPAAERVPVPAVTGAPPGPSTRNAPARVLIADDNADMRGYLTRLLRGAGHQVLAVADGLEALDRVRADLPELVISDVMMPGLDGLRLVTALREDPRTATVPVLLLSARAGQEASIEGFDAGADDYLVKPFAATELLARVRAVVAMARLRGHHTRWHGALVDSLQDAFFVCDADGTVVETNAAFTHILGYGPEGLPYRPPHPWWPDAAADPEAHRQATLSLTRMTTLDHGVFSAPVTHRDGHRLWVHASFNRVQDPDTGRTAIVGTLRDVTAEHYAIQRESALAALGERLAGAGSVEEALAHAIHVLHDLWRAHSVVAARFDRGDTTAPRRLTTTTGTRETPAEPPAPRSPEWRDLDEARRAALSGLASAPTLTPVPGLGGAGIRIDHPDGPLALWIELGEHRFFTDEDELLLSLLAGRLTQGLARARRIDQQRETAIALQRAILGPSNLPDGFAVRYEPAGRPLEVGGDWYDTFALPDGRIGIVVGDCVGRGLEAAAVMGQLRSACRALLIQDLGPARALMALDSFAATVPGAMCTTVFCGVLDPSTGELRYSSAGHPPGILRGADGSSLLLEGGRALPLAVRPGRTRPEAAAVIPGRSVLLLCTDGLVERRGLSLTDGFDQADLVLRQGMHLPPDQLADHLMSRLAPAGGYTDDVALMLYRHPARLETSFAADRDRLAAVRDELRRWLAACHVPGPTARGALAAAGEAVANAVEHAYADGTDGTVRLTARATGDRLHIEVADAGSWREPDPRCATVRGRGIPLMRRLMDHITLTPGPGGTTVGMDTRIVP